MFFKQLALGAIALTFAQTVAAKTLDIYFIDVEGGQATLIVTPSRETFLIDAGFPGAGEFQSKPGDPRQARDANRILAAVRDAGAKQIDYLMVTHFHADHAGGVAELSQLLPIRTFIDHGNVLPDAEKNAPGTLAMFDTYAAARAKGSHLKPKPGERLLLRGVDVTIVSSAGATLSKPLIGANGANAACIPPGRAAQEINENPRSTGALIQFGKFRFLDVGDLSGAPLFALVCPNDMIGQVDVYLVAHHGGADAVEPATFAALKPRVSIVNNGPSKGGAPELLAYLRGTKDSGDAWQLHFSQAAGKENVSAEQIANLDEQTAHWIKISAGEDGAFRVLNKRTGVWRQYPKR